MSYYDTLGVGQNASPEEIKAAYKKMAMKFHPDRNGGNEAKFKEVNEAYSTLSDPEKKMMYDHGGNQPHFGSHTGGQFHDFGFNPFGNMPPEFQDIMGNFGFSFRTNNMPQRNRDLNLKCRVSLKDTYTGKNVDITYRLPSGRDEKVTLHIPAGVENGMTLKVSEYGDDSIPTMRRGDLTVIIETDKDPRFHREDLNLVTSIEIDIFEAMLGCKKTVKNIDDTNIEIDIQPGTQHGRKYSCHDLGFQSVKYTNLRGHLIINVTVKTPVIKDPQLAAMVNELANKVRGSNR
jgi:curved DNA-binding protein